MFFTLCSLEASKVQLLKAENRRLVNELQSSKGKPVFQPDTAKSSESQNESWEDSDEANNSPLTSYGRDLKTASMEETTEREMAAALGEVEDDEDVRKVVAMLENVEFTDTLADSTARYRHHSSDVTATPPEGDSDEQQQRSDGGSTPRDLIVRRRHDSDRGSYSTRKSNRFR